MLQHSAWRELLVCRVHTRVNASSSYVIIVLDEIMIPRSICISLFLCLSAFAQDKNACTGDPNQWRQIFDGKDLTGWKHVGPGNMTVENGLIHTHGGMGLLYWTAGPHRELHSPRGVPYAR